MVHTVQEALVAIRKIAPRIMDAMTPAPTPLGEQERLAAIAQLDLNGINPEPAIDRITAKVTRLFDVPMGMVTLLDHDRLLIKSHIGLSDELATAREMPRDVSVCGHLLAANDSLVVEDLARDRRFANNPWLREHRLRFYAGVPLRTGDGQAIGALCLIDTKPRSFTDRETRQLQEYATDLMEELEKQRIAK